MRSQAVRQLAAELGGWLDALDAAIPQYSAA
jgi:hypothetical protein